MTDGLSSLLPSWESERRSTHQNIEFSHVHSKAGLLLVSSLTHRPFTNCWGHLHLLHPFIHALSHRNPRLPTLHSICRLLILTFEIAYLASCSLLQITHNDLHLEHSGENRQHGQRNHFT